MARIVTMPDIITAGTTTTTTHSSPPSNHRYPLGLTPGGQRVSRFRRPFSGQRANSACFFRAKFRAGDLSFLRRAEGLMLGIASVRT